MLLVMGASFIMLGSSSAYALSNTTVNTVAVSDDPGDGKCDLWEALAAAWDSDHGNDSDGDGSLTTYHECSTGAFPHGIVFSGADAGGTITLHANLYNRPFTGLP